VDDSVFTEALLPLALAIIMISLGLSLTPADFKRVFVLPRGVAIGITNLLLISPFLAFAIAELYGLSPELAVGLVLLGASPGGTTANMLTHLARGDTALSVTMTAISSVAAVVTVPLYLDLSITHFDAGGVTGDVGMVGIVARVFLITIVPLSIGMWIRSRSPARVEALEPRVKRIAMVTFLVVVAGAVAAEFEKVTENFADVAAAALTLNVTAMAISFTIARLARLSDAQATAIAMELGVHNATLAIAVAATVSSVLTIPAAVYSVFMFVTAGLFAKVMHSRNAPSAREPASEPVTA
jgi:BASS family bile acid:Na+ symporter